MVDFFQKKSKRRTSCNAKRKARTTRDFTLRNQRTALPPRMCHEPHPQTLPCEINASDDATAGHDI